MKRGPGLFALLVGLLFLFLIGKGALIQPPSVRAPSASSFDTARAFGRLERILGNVGPHIVDSPANAVVRERIVAELRALGIEPLVRDQTACARFRQSVECARVRNIVATIGPPEGPHLLLATHYDSSTVGPGAADAGIGVASMLEIAAILKSEPLRRPVTFLFDEGEETGLLGARAFLDGDPLAAQVDTVLNMEARGVNGPALMFETSVPNGSAIGAYGDGAWRPFANSLSADVYRLLPNDTDATFFAERPWTILNFAIAGNETRYHTAGDDLVSLSRASLQHMGTEVLGTARAVATGESDDTADSTQTMIYTDLYGLFLISMPLTIGLALLALSALVLAVVAWRRQALGRPLLTVVAGFLAAGVAGFAIDWVVHLFRPADYWRAYPLVTFAGFYALALLAAATMLWTLGRGIERSRLRSAFWLLFVVLGGIVCLIAPGGSIYFLLPALAAAISALLGRSTKVAQVLDWVAALWLLLTFGEVLSLFELMLVYGPYWILSLLGFLAVMPLLIEARPAETDAGRPLVLAPIGAVAAIAWVAVLLLPRSSEDRQAVFAIEYFRDLGSGRSTWAINNSQITLPEAFDAFGEWTLARLPYSGRQRWTMPAPNASVPQPSAELVAQQARPDGTRQVRIRLHPNMADQIALRIPAGAHVRLAGANGSIEEVPAPEGDAHTVVRCTGETCEGTLIDLVVNAGPVDAQIISTRFALPPEARPLVAARPANARPQYGPNAIVVAAPLRF